MQRSLGWHSGRHWKRSLVYLCDLEKGRMRMAVEKSVGCRKPGFNTLSCE